tara:strand:- start:6074 stop:7543 length:1470 start_codon:yes stop_codon:yes gene_type:complete
MDIAAIGLLSLAGYELSSRKKKKSEIKNDKPPLEETKFKDGSEGHTNMQHHYSGTQAPGLPMSHNKLGIHTGSNLMEHASRNCRPEPDNIFAPLKSLVHVNGAPNVDLKDRYEPSLKMHNVLPFEQKRVGNGLNTDSDSKGGFHQYLRVKPKNVDGYRKNTLPQRIIPGKQQITAREQLPVVDAPKIARHYTMEDHPMEQQKFGTQGPTKRAIADHRPNTDTVNEIYFGGAHQKGTNSSSVHTSRDKDSTSVGRDGHVTGHTYRPSNTVNSYIVHETDREDCGNQPLNPKGNVDGTYTRDVDASIEPTTRSTTNNTHILNTTGNKHVTYSSNYDVAQATHRNNTSTSYKGVAHGYERSGENRDYVANDTQRESTSHSYIGPSKYFTSEQMNTGSRQEQYTMKEDAVRGYTPGAKGTQASINPENMNVEFKSDNNTGSRVNVPKVGIVTTQKNILGRIEHEQKIPSENTRDFFSVANVVLHDNPLAIKIN